jgi:hypothetical protein
MRCSGRRHRVTVAIGASRGRTSNVIIAMNVARGGLSRIQQRAGSAADIIFAGTEPT